MRAAADPQFAEYLLSVRDGSANIGGGDDIVVPNDMLVELRTPLRNQKDEECALIDGLINRVSRHPILFELCGGMCSSVLSYFNNAGVWKIGRRDFCSVDNPVTNQ
jgi:hypothetical protein